MSALPLAATLAFALARPAAAAPPQFLVDGLSACVDRLARDAADERRALAVRDLPNGALADLALGRAPARAQGWLDLLFAQQNMNPASPDYGTVPWQIRGKTVADANAIEFSMQAVGPLFLRYGANLEHGYLEKAAPHLKAAVAAIERHDVKVAYTNIYLMKTANLILLGQLLGDDATVKAGEKLLDDWLAWTAANGIGEYDSPTYDKVDANDLLYGLLYAKDPADKEKFRAALDYLWTDIAANYFVGRSSLSGPHSRDYDFLEGRGGIDVFFATYGWNPPPQKFEELDLESVALLQSEIDGGYRPPETLRALRERPERLVLSRFGPELGQDRTNYLTTDFAIGSASRDTGPQDKPFSIQLNAPGRFPDIVVVVDDSGAPYGKRKVEGRDGHSKPQHLPSRPVAVQDRGLVLATFDASPDQRRPSRELTTNVILPAAPDELAVDGVPARLGERTVLNSDATLSVRAGAAFVLIRVPAMAACAGESPELTLSVDGEGRRWGAARLTISHHNPARGDVPSNCRAASAILFQALNATTDSDRAAALAAFRQAAFSESAAGGAWTVEANLAGRRLRVQRDLSRGTVLSRTIDGQEAAFAPLSVDGVPVVLGAGGPSLR